jgi:type I restriction enzyme S subunit
MSKDGCWKELKIRDIVSFLKSGLSRSIVFEDIGIPVITSTNLIDGYLDANEFKFWFVKDPQGANTSDFLLEDGDILLNFINSISQIGKVCLYKNIGRDAIYTTNLFRIKPNHNVTNKFLWRLLESENIQHWIQLITKPAINQASFTQGDFLSIPIKLPSLPEQERIAEILDTLDETIAKTEECIAKLKKIKVGLVHDLLTRGIDENGELRDPVRHPEQFKQSAIGLIPKGWDICNVEAILKESPRNGYSPKEINNFTGTLMLGLGCLTEDGFVPCQLKNAPNIEDSYDFSFLNDGDLLISRSNTKERVGFIGIYKAVDYPCIYPDLMMKLTPNFEIEKSFLEIVLRHYSSRSQLIRKAQGTSESMMKISSAIVKSVWIPLPRKPEQFKILSYLDSTNENLTLECQFLKKLKLQKKGLMHDLLTGKVRVNHLL